MTRRRSYEQQNVGGDAHIAPPISFPQIFRYAAGRIISAPTFTHTFSKRPGRRGRRPLQFVLADIVGMAGRPRAASPTIRFRKRHSNGRADNIRPYISAYVVPKAGTSRMAGTSRTPSPTLRLSVHFAEDRANSIKNGGGTSPPFHCTMSSNFPRIAFTSWPGLSLICVPIRPPLM